MKESKNSAQKPLWKTVLIFAAIIVASLVIGLFFGAGAATVRNTVADIGLKSRLIDALPTVSFVAFAAVWVIGGGICVAFFGKAKKLYAAWDGENEQQVSRIEGLLGKYLIVTNWLYLLPMIFFTLWFYGMTGNAQPSSIAFPILFLASVIAVIIMQRAAVELVKRINPEKRGEVLDLKFQKNWENSMDEGEKLNMYKAAYRAFRVVNYLCMSLWLLGILLHAAFSVGILAAVYALIIWLVSVSVYQVTAMKLEQGKKTDEAGS